MEERRNKEENRKSIFVFISPELIIKLWRKLHKMRHRVCDRDGEN